MTYGDLVTLRLILNKAQSMPDVCRLPEADMARLRELVDRTEAAAEWTHPHPAAALAAQPPVEPAAQQVEPILPVEEQKRIANNAYNDCKQIPGATFYNAAQFAITETLAALAAQPPAPQAPVMWQYRWFDANRQQWNDWEECKARNVHTTTAEDFAAEVAEYIKQGNRYELRALGVVDAPPPKFSRALATPSTEGAK